MANRKIDGVSYHPKGTFLASSLYPLASQRRLCCIASRCVVAVVVVNWGVKHGTAVGHSDCASSQDKTIELRPYSMVEAIEYERKRIGRMGCRSRTLS